jgi:hypothetical protein
MKLQFWCTPCAIGVVILFLGLVTENAFAREGRSGGGGYSRESPASSGSLSSRSGSKQEPQASAQSSRQQYGSSAQSSRQQYSSSAQSTRDQTATSMQSSREQTATGMQSSHQQTATGMQSSAHRYHGAYPPTSSASTTWDAGAGFAAATTGAAIGAAVASSKPAQPSTAVVYATPAATQPCASPTVVPVGGSKYFKCGSAWYSLRPEWPHIGSSGPATRLLSTLSVRPDGLGALPRSYRLRRFKILKLSRFPATGAPYREFPTHATTEQPTATSLVPHCSTSLAAVS